MLALVTWPGSVDNVVSFGQIFIGCQIKKKHLVWMKALYEKSCIEMPVRI